MLAAGLGLAWLAGASGCVYHAVKPLPAGTAFRSGEQPAYALRFLGDLTGHGADGERRCDQQIFDEVLARIARAERLVLVDLFLFQTFGGAGTVPHRRLSGELTEALLARKRAVPSLRAILITDPVNTVYGGLEAGHLQRLEAAGVRLPASAFRQRVMMED